MITRVRTGYPGVRHKANIFLCILASYSPPGKNGLKMPPTGGQCFLGVGGGSSASNTASHSKAFCVARVAQAKQNRKPYDSFGKRVK